MEQAEVYFKRRRDELERLRGTFLNAGASSSHDVFLALDRLDNLYMWLVAAMQEVRWSVLISDGVRDGADSPPDVPSRTSSEWVASLDGD